MMCLLEQCLNGQWIEIFRTSAKEMTAEEKLDFVKTFSKASEISLVYENEQGQDVAIIFDGTTGPLRGTFY